MKVKNNRVTNRICPGCGSPIVAIKGRVGYVRCGKCKQYACPSCWMRGRCCTSFAQNKKVIGVKKPLKRAKYGGEKIQG